MGQKGPQKRVFIKEIFFNQNYFGRCLWPFLWLKKSDMKRIRSIWLHHAHEELSSIGTLVNEGEGGGWYLQYPRNIIQRMGMIRMGFWKIFFIFSNFSPYKFNPPEGQNSTPNPTLWISIFQKTPRKQKKIGPKSATK